MVILDKKIGENHKKGVAFSSGMMYTLIVNETGLAVKAAASA
jgi:hypothetical protein